MTDIARGTDGASAGLVGLDGRPITPKREATLLIIQVDPSGDLSVLAMDGMTDHHLTTLRGSFDTWERQYRERRMTR
jgi:hypothetical protein